MRKLLSVLGIISLISTSSLSVVACSDSSARVDNKLSDDLKKMINAQIVDGDYQKFGSLTNEQIWNSNQDVINNLIVQLLNEDISRYFYKVQMENRNNNLDSKLHKDVIDKLAQEAYSSDVDGLTSDNLFQTYSQDYQQHKYLENDLPSKGYQPDIESSDWYAPGSYAPIMGSAASGGNLTGNTWKDDWKFGDPEISADVVQKDLSNPVNQDLKNPTKSFQYWKDHFNGAKSPNDINNLKTQLMKRFKTYAYNEIQTNMFKRMLTVNLLQETEFEWNAKNKVSFINTGSPLFNIWQNWSKDNWSSNVKMVWEYQYKKSTLSTHTTAINRLANINHLKSASSTDTTSLESLFGTGADKLPPVDPTTSSSLGKYSDNNIGADPIFGNQGYEGLYGIRDGKIFTQNTDNKDITPYTSELIDTKNSTPGFLKDTSNTNYWFLDSNNNQYVTLAFTIPVNPMDLMFHSESSGTQHDINYIPGHDGSKVSNMDYDNNTDLFNEWTTNPKYSKRISSDISSLGAPIKNQLFSLVESTIAESGLGSGATSADTGLTNEAEQIYYSYAFNYNQDNIYSKALFDKIGKYVKKNDE